MQWYTFLDNDKVWEKNCLQIVAKNLYFYSLTVVIYKLRFYSEYLICTYLYNLDIFKKVLTHVQLTTTYLSNGMKNRRNEMNQK